MSCTPSHIYWQTRDALPRRWYASVVVDRSEMDGGLPAINEKPSFVEGSWILRHTYSRSPLLQCCTSANCTLPDSTSCRTPIHCKPILLDAPHWALNNAKVNSSVVFWPIGGTNPAHSLRILLIRAGIETNPGPTSKPASGPPCEACGVRIRRKKSGELMSHFVCAEKGCKLVCHLQDQCSLITRASRIKIKWYCNSHRNPASPPHPRLEQRRPLTPSNELCPICHIKLKATPLQCTICNKKSHQAEGCSGHTCTLSRRQDQPENVILAQ